MNMIYTATSKAHADEDDQSDHHFVSIDNEHWLEVATPWPMTSSHYDELTDAFAVKVSADGTRRSHITLATAYLRCWCREIVFHDTIEVTA